MNFIECIYRCYFKSFTRNIFFTIFAYINVCLDKSAEAIYLIYYPIYKLIMYAQLQESMDYEYV